METQKKLVSKLVKLTLTDTDRLRIGRELSEAINRKRNVEAEFDDVKSSYKAKLTAAESEIDRNSTTLSLGFEMRTEPVWVTYLPKEGKKEYRLEKHTAKDAPVAVLDMEPEDYALELIEAEEPFVHRLTFQLLEIDQASVSVVLASTDKVKWVSALRGKIGSAQFNERLDSLQRTSNGPGPALELALVRLGEAIEAKFPGRVEVYERDLKEKLAEIKAKLPPPIPNAKKK